MATERQWLTMRRKADAARIMAACEAAARSAALERPNAPPLYMDLRTAEVALRASVILSDRAVESWTPRAWKEASWYDETGAWSPCSINVSRETARTALRKLAAGGVVKLDQPFNRGGVLRWTYVAPGRGRYEAVAAAERWQLFDLLFDVANAWYPREARKAAAAFGAAYAAALEHLDTVSEEG
jgi:hypothetical protein